MNAKPEAILRDWSLVVLPNEQKTCWELRIFGTVIFHPGFPLGQNVVTGPLVAIDYEHGDFAETEATRYELRNPRHDVLAQVSP